jgi:hypothetical protein
MTKSRRKEEVAVLERVRGVWGTRRRLEDRRGVRGR